MKPNISLACKKSPFFPPVKTVPGQFPRGKLSSKPSPNPKASPNPNPNRESNFLWGRIGRTPVKTKETKNTKEMRQ